MNQVDQTKKSKFNGKAWIIVIAIFIAGIAMAWTQNKVMPVIGLVQADLHVSAFVAGWISGIFNVLGIVLAFPAVGMVRQWGVLKGGIVSIFVTLVGSIIGFFAPNEIVLFASRVIEGFGIGLISIIAPSTIAMWFPIEKRGFPMGIWSSWQMVAIAGSFLFTGNIIGPEGAWKHMWIVGIFLLVIGLVLFAWKVRPPSAAENHADVEDSSVKVSEVFKHRSVYIMSIGGMGFGMAIMTFATWIATFWSQQAGMDPATANSVVGYVYLAEIFTAMLGGFILDKVKNRKRFVSIDGILYALVFLAAFNVKSLPFIVIVCILYCVIEGVFAAAMWSLITQTTPDPRLAGASTAFYSMFLNLGMMLGAPIAGAILDATNSQGWGYLAIFAAVCQVVGGICFGLVKLYNEKGEEVKS
jgi:predicted MFS family arabinose efflux permease